MKYEQFSAIYNALKSISSDESLNQDNVIGAIKSQLSPDSDAYKEWEKGKFSLDHVFTTDGYQPENTLLIHACDSADLEVVRFLLKVGASVNVAAGDKNPFTVAIEKEYGNPQHKNLVNLLIKEVNAHVNTAGENVNNTIVKAVERGNFRVFNALKEAGASLDIEAPSGTLLKWAEDHQSDPMIKKEAMEEIINTLKAHSKGKDKTPEIIFCGKHKEEAAKPDFFIPEEEDKQALELAKQESLLTASIWSKHKGKIALGGAGLCVAGAIAAYVLAYPAVALALAVLAAVILMGAGIAKVLEDPSVEGLSTSKEQRA